MRINARLDQTRTRKLDFLKQATRLRITDIVKRAIDLYYEQVRRTHSSKPAEILESTGFIGSAEGSAELSETYKRDLPKELAAKHDHR